MAPKNTREAHGIYTRRHNAQPGNKQGYHERDATGRHKKKTTNIDIDK